MFRDELHSAFDGIKPSAELLDRVSAMMSEEVSRPRPAIRMSAAKYAGVAAAVVVAAGGTIAALRLGSGVAVNTDTTAKNAAVAETAAAAMNDSAAAAEGAAAEKYEEEENELFIDDSVVIEPAYEDDSVVVFTTQEHAEEIAEAASDEADAGEAADASAKAAEAADDSYENSVIEDAEEADFEDSASDKTDMDMSISAAVAPQLITEAAVAPDIGAGAAENSATGGGALVYEEPFTDLFLTIPRELEETVDGVLEYIDGDIYIMGARWKEYMRSLPEYKLSSDSGGDDAPIPPVEAGDRQSGYADVTSIDSYINVYTFIQYFGIPEDKVREALAGTYTDEQLDILLSGDKAAVTAAFASEYAIVKGEKIYSPLWLDRNDIAVWREAGITKDDIGVKYEKLTKIPLLAEDIQARITAKLDSFRNE